MNKMKRGQMPEKLKHKALSMLKTDEVDTDREDGIQLSHPYYHLDNWFYIEKK